MSSETVQPPQKNAVARSGRDVPFVPQLTPTDCGAACLSSVLAFHEKHVPIHEVRNMLGGGRNGVNARELLAAGRAFGFNARGVGVEPNKLRYLPPGSIMHWELNHFVVFQRCTERVVHVVDPALGRRQLPMVDVAKMLSGVALVFEPGNDFEKQKPERRGRLGRYAAWIFGVRGIWLRVVLTSFFLQLLALSAPGLMSTLVDKVVPRGDSQLLYLVGAGFLSVASFYFLSTLLRSRLLLELRTKVESRMSFDFIDHLLALPYGFFQARTTGDLMMRLSSQTSIRELLTTGALSAMLDGAMVTVYFFLLLGAAPILALVALVLAILQIVTYLLAGRRNTQLVIEGLAAQSRLEGYQVEMLAGIETLKSMGATDRSMARWNDLYVDSLNRAISRGLLDGTFQAFLGTLRFCGPIALIVTGAYKVLDGTLSLGTMLGLSALGAGFLDPVANLVSTAMRLTQLGGYMDRIEDVLETPREALPARPSSRAAARLDGDIDVRELSFKYPSEPRATLEDVSFHVASGECVAVVGSSGSGKSTLARLLAGLYVPLGGSISFDGLDLRSWDLTTLRERLGIVTQETRLFSGTIRDNVALFETTVSEEEVERACRLACLHDAVERMPMGYDTMLADGGSSLSGGQRQRLSLARALVRNPSVLVLDEATSALDTATERRVQENLRTLDCTRVIVAHRLSTIVEADKIVVLEQGRIVAIGRHADLLASCEAYRGLVHAQSGGPSLGAFEGKLPAAARPRAARAVPPPAFDPPTIRRVASDVVSAESVIAPKGFAKLPRKATFPFKDT
jgi:ABC-type bacteriocin/lantibiotic exporter with double-glycine peptidase domain